MTFEPRDVVTLLLSLSTLVLSLIALRQKITETQRTVRQQLTDAIGKLSATFEAFEKLRQEKVKEWSHPPAVTMRIYYNGQKLFYARQATYLMEQIPSLVSDVEYNTVARAFSDNEDLIEAAKFYEKAIAAAPKPVYRAMHMRGYARVLLISGDRDGAKAKFEEALRLVPGDKDDHLWFRAETLQRWAQAEADCANKAHALQLFGAAEKLYEQVRFPPRRKLGLDVLSTLRSAYNYQ